MTSIPNEFCLPANITVFDFLKTTKKYFPKQKAKNRPNSAQITQEEMLSALEKSMSFTCSTRNKNDISMPFPKTAQKILAGPFSRGLAYPSFFFQVYSLFKHRANAIQHRYARHNGAAFPINEELSPWFRNWVGDAWPGIEITDSSSADSL